MKTELMQTKVMNISLSETDVTWTGKDYTKLHYVTWTGKNYTTLHYVTWTGKDYTTLRGPVKTTLRYMDR